jgi:hypothetical protein
MGTKCQHRFDDVPMVFTGTLRTRACCACDHVEVLPVPVTGEWVDLEEYLSRRVEDRSRAARNGKLIGG